MKFISLQQRPLVGYCCSWLLLQFQKASRPIDPFSLTLISFKHVNPQGDRGGRAGLFFRIERVHWLAVAVMERSMMMTGRRRRPQQQQPRRWLLQHASRALLLLLPQLLSLLLAAAIVPNSSAFIVPAPRHPPQRSLGSRCNPASPWPLRCELCGGGGGSGAGDERRSQERRNWEASGGGALFVPVEEGKQEGADASSKGPSPVVSGGKDPAAGAMINFIKVR